MSTRSKMVLLAKAVELLVAEKADEFGLEVTVNTKDSGPGMKISVQITDHEAEAREFKLFAGRFNYDPEWLGRQVSFNGSIYDIVGVKSSADTNCIKIRRRPDGKGFVCNVGTVRGSLVDETPLKEES